MKTFHGLFYLRRTCIAVLACIFELAINGMHFLSSFKNFWIHASLDYVIIVDVHGQEIVLVYTLKDSLIQSQVLGSQPVDREN